MTPLDRLGVHLPIVQAPMAGVSTPELAAAVSNAGALGSLGVGAVDARGARAMIEAARGRTDRPFNVNLFVHDPAVVHAEREQGWLQALGPLFESYGAKPPSALRTIYTSFAEDDEMLAMLVATGPAVVSFHFGLPSADRIAALKDVGDVSRRESQREGSADDVGEDVDLGRLAATRGTDRLRFGPPFPPKAQRCALT